MAHQTPSLFGDRYEPADPPVSGRCPACDRPSVLGTVCRRCERAGVSAPRLDLAGSAIEPGPPFPCALAPDAPPRHSAPCAYEPTWHDPGPCHYCGRDLDPAMAPTEYAAPCVARGDDGPCRTRPQHDAGIGDCLADADVHVDPRD